MSIVNSKRAAIGCFVLLNILLVLLAVRALYHSYSIEKGLHALSVQSADTQVLYDAISADGVPGANSALKASSPLLILLSSSNEDDLEQAVQLTQDFLYELTHDSDTANSAHKSLSNDKDLSTIEKINRFYQDFSLLVPPLTNVSYSDDYLNERSAYFYDSLSQGLIIPADRDPYLFANERLLEITDTLSRFSSQELTRFTNKDYFALIERNISVANEQTLMQIADELADLVQAIPNIKLTVSGADLVGARIAQTASKEMTVLGSITVGLTLLLLWLCFRKLSALALPVLCILGSGCFALLVTMNVFSGIHLFSLVLGISLIGVVIDYVIHVMYYRAITWAIPSAESHQAPHRELDEPFRGFGLVKALLLSGITSCLAYLLLAIGDVLVIQQIAIFAAAGIIYALSFAVVLSYSRESFLTNFFISQRSQACKTEKSKKSAKKDLSGLHKVENTAGSFSQSKSFIIVVVALAALLLIASAYSRYSKFAHDSISTMYLDTPASFFKAPDELLEVFTLRSLYSATQTFEPGRFIVIEAASYDELYERLQTFREKLAETVGTQMQLYGFDSALPSLHLLQSRQMQPFYQEESFVLYQSSVGAIFDTSTEQLNLLYKQQAHAFEKGGVDEYKNIARDLGVVESGDRLYAILGILLSAEDKAQQLGALADITESDASSRYISFLNEAEETLKTMRRSTLIAVALAAAFLAMVFLTFFPIRFALLAAGGLTLVVLCTFFTTLMLAPVTIFAIVPLFLILGLGIDYLVFIYHEFDREDSFPLAFPAPFSRSVSIAAACSLISFSMLSFSQFQAIADFAFVLFLGTFLSLLLALISHRVLPRLKLKAKDAQR